MRRTSVNRFSPLLLLMSALTAGPVGTAFCGDDPPADKTGGKPAEIAPPTAKDLADRRMVFMKSALARYSVEVGGRKEPAVVGDPCLRWSNPVGTSADGVVGVYAQNGGRPAALVQFFVTGRRRWVNEFTIIPDGDVTILRSGRVFWKPAEFVCKFTDLPGAPPPAASPVLRSAQMRAIAADFSATDYFGAKAIKNDLRLLPQPVYRYAEAGAILDGAVFIFALTTDPECCLLVEAYPGDKGSRYRYALAPMSIYRLEVRYKDKPVWSIERRDPAGEECRAYYAGVYVPEPGEDLPESGAADAGPRER